MEKITQPSLLSKICLGNNESKDNRAYILGVMSRAPNREQILRVPQLQNKVASISAAVPGQVSKWIKENGGVEVQDCLHDDGPLLVADL